MSLICLILSPPNYDLPISLAVDALQTCLGAVLFQRDGCESLQSIFRLLSGYSFIQTISIAPLQVTSHAEAPPTQHRCCAGVLRRNATGNRELKTCPRSLRGGYSGSQTHDPPVESYRLNQCATTSHVTVFTDHSPLRYIEAMRNHNFKLMRWSLEMQRYCLDVQHRPGKLNLLPNLLSRPASS